MTVKEFYEYCKSVGAENCIIRVDTVQKENNFSFYPTTMNLSYDCMKECVIDVWSPEEEKKLKKILDKIK